MERIIYHGSERIIRMPAFGLGKTYNDYGQGFYCTENPDMAKEWSVQKDRNGFSNRYIIREDGLKILSLTDEPYTILHWLTILIQNRIPDTYSMLAEEASEYLKKNFSLPYEKYDVIRGYRADDSYFSFTQDFLNGTISLQQLSRSMHLGKMGEQYVLKSEAAFRRIRFDGYETAFAGEWYVRKKSRDQKARNDYFDRERNRRSREDLYITEILDEEMTENNARLRQALS